MSQATRRTYSGTPLWPMKPRENRSTAAGSLPGRHVDDIVLHETGDHGDAIAAPAAGPVDADGLHTHVVLQPPRLVDAMGDGPPQTGVGLVQLPGERDGGQVAGRLHGPRLEQEREPAAGPGPRGGHRPHPVLGARDAGHGGVDERLAPEEVRMPPHTPRLSCTGQASSRRPVSGQWKRAPGSKPIMMRSSRRPPSASRKSTDPTFQGDCNRSAAVNR